ncbi:hypothetical protein LBMAG56_03870 [Verrucomicrobiota bacterium]|nr:hypothetical protein LBMAG56_03870 [Verrucomicrobiota bacterium]
MTSRIVPCSRWISANIRAKSYQRSRPVQRQTTSSYSTKIGVEIARTSRPSSNARFNGAKGDARPNICTSVFVSNTTVMGRRAGAARPAPRG